MLTGGMASGDLAQAPAMTTLAISAAAVPTAGS